MKISLILASGLNGEIGKDNDLLWKKQKADMNRFKEFTKGHTVLMGRNTWESIPSKFRPLPGRTNIIISSTLHMPPSGNGVFTCRSLEEGINAAKRIKDRDLFIIGGARAYNEAAYLADRIVYTLILEDFPDADTHVDIPWDQYELVSASEDFPADEDNNYPYRFEEYVRRVQ